jgi:AcrR family transcriptional regulator
MNKRESILKAALLLFSEKGFYGTTMDEIAEKAMVAKGSIYTYFKSKQDLFISIITEGFGILRNKFEEISEKPLSSKEKIEEAVSFYLDYFEKHRHFFKTILFERRSLMGRKISPSKREEHRREYEKLIDILSAIFDEGIKRGEFKPYNSWVMANSLMGMADRLMFLSLLRRDKGDLSELRESLFKIFFNGVLRED